MDARPLDREHWFAVGYQIGKARSYGTAAATAKARAHAAVAPRPTFQRRRGLRFASKHQAVEDVLDPSLVERDLDLLAARAGYASAHPGPRVDPSATADPRVPRQLVAVRKHSRGDVSRPGPARDANVVKAHRAIDGGTDIHVALEVAARRK